MIPDFLTVKRNVNFIKKKVDVPSITSVWQQKFNGSMPVFFKTLEERK